MIEPLSAGAVAVGTILATKAMEKVGENIGDSLSHKTKEFLESLKEQKPDTVTAIEKAPAQPLDYGQAVLDVEEVAKADPTFNQTLQELATLTETQAPANLADFLKEIKAALATSQHPQLSTFNQNLEKAINAAQNQTIDQRGSTFQL